MCAFFFFLLPCELPRWSPRFLIMSLNRLDYANWAFIAPFPSTSHGTERPVLIG